jgi:hypothetical protein
MLETTDEELCLSLVTAIVEQVAVAAAARSGEHPFEIEARLLRQLMQNLPRQIEAAEGAARMTVEDGSDSSVHSISHGREK